VETVNIDKIAQKLYNILAGFVIFSHQQGGLLWKI
jgi:hypothetical protein